METNTAVASFTYERRIRASNSWWNIDWREIWQYRDLLYLLVRRDFVARYAQSVLGPAWFILQPLLTTLIFTVVFGGIAKISTSGVPPVLFYLCNQIAWMYFASSFTATSTTLTGNQHIFSKVYFPRLIVPASSLISNCFALVVQLVTFFAFFICYKLTTPSANFQLTWLCLLLPIFIGYLAVLATGFGLTMAAITGKYRDLTQLSGVLIQLWMYATPVIYPISEVPEKWRWLVSLNPVAAPVELFRLALLGQGTVSPQMLLTSVIFTLVIFLIGISLFTRAERTFVDVA